MQIVMFLNNLLDNRLPIVTRNGIALKRQRDTLRYSIVFHKKIAKMTGRKKVYH